MFKMCRNSAGYPLLRILGHVDMIKIYKSLTVSKIRRFNSLQCMNLVLIVLSRIISVKNSRGIGRNLLSPLGINDATRIFLQVRCSKSQLKQKFRASSKMLCAQKGKFFVSIVNLIKIRGSVAFCSRDGQVKFLGRKKHINVKFVFGKTQSHIESRDAHLFKPLVS